MTEPAADLDTEDTGTGSVLVLVHGYLGSARHWDGQVPVLSRHLRCIVPNLAGFGDSAALPALDSVEGHAAQVLATLDRMGIERFCLLGHSMGGMVAQQMASMAGHRIDKLILYGTGPVGVLPGRFETIETSRARLESDGVEATARRIVSTWFETEEKSEGFAVCLAEGKRASLAAALASLSAWEGWDGRSALSSLGMPTLVIWGDGDRSYAWEQPETLWRTIPDCRLAVVPCCAHAVHLEKPAFFNALVLDFIGKEPGLATG